MRYLALACAALALAMLFPAAGEAQQRTLSIDQVQVGYGPLPLLADFKSGAWTPVYISVKAGLDGTKKGEIIVESADSDDVRNHYAIMLPPLEPNDMVTLLAYTRPGSAGNEITVSARIDGRIVASRPDHYSSLNPDQQLFLTIGGRLAGLRAEVRPPSTVKGGEEDESDADVRDNASRRVVALRELPKLPTRWFAYEPVDLMVLTTGDREFVTGLLNERENRKEALVDWVRRGGRLIVSVGRNQDLVANLEPIQTILPVSIAGLLQMPRLRCVGTWGGGGDKNPFVNARRKSNPTGQPPPIDVAKLEPKPGRETDTLLKEEKDTPIIVQGAYGLGRVTVVAFDLDSPPFTTWGNKLENQKAFWHQFLEKTAPRQNQTTQGRPGFQPYGQQDGNDLASQLQMNLEDFEDVPVISFGWVALFILLYILVVGPLDYFFLKKVVKRLELTWITFPTVVITISVAAYFTAYWLKGNDQKINKIDLIDVDLHTQRVYGNTWFTIFSPRIQHYTIGVEPVAGSWVPEGAGGRPDSSMLLTWMGRPEGGWGSPGRSHSQGLFRRAYDYTPDASALVGVPIQVWSTKSFAASWQAPLDPSRPLISANLWHPQGDPNKLQGDITSRIPVPLEDVALYWPQERDRKWCSLDRLLPEVPQTVANIQKMQEPRKALLMTDWLSTSPTVVARKSGSQGPRVMNASNESTATVLKRLMFFEAPEAYKNHRITSLRNLDQYWRLNHKDEVILFGRIARVEGVAEDIANNPTSPTRLWLGALPGSTLSRPPLSGNLSQETYVRVIIPIRPGKPN
jgi:hypothetical protein